MKKIASLLLLFVLLTTSSATTTDPFAGRWKLNVRRSSYPAGTCPKQMTIEMLPKGQAVEYRSDTTYANGKNAQTTYLADYTGKQVIVIGSHGMLLPVSLKRIAPRVVIASYLHGFEVVATSRRVVSNDGRWMTITTKSKDNAGKIVTSVGVYQRE